jgi:sugar lactone lactonase YvrE/uncharacterized protein YecT (DUF1311 family)
MRFLIVPTVACVAAVIVPISAAGSDVTDLHGLAFDGNGNLFVADSGNGTILKFTPEGDRNTFASGLRDPLGLAFDGKGNLWVTTSSSMPDSLSGTILKFTPEGAQSTFASGLKTPSDLAFDKAGNLFVSDSASNSIVKFGADGTKTSFASGLSWPLGLAFDAAGNLFVADSQTGTIFKLAGKGTKTSFASGLKLPFGLAFDAAGNLFVADEEMGTILKINSKGTRTTFASWLKAPTGLAFDKAGNLFMSGNDSIFKFTPNGTRSTFLTGSSDNTAYATADNTSISPSKEWEYRSFSTEEDAKIVNRSTNQVVLDLSDKGPGGVLWAPNSKRFALNYGRGRTHETSLYQWRDDQWVELESRDEVYDIAQKAITAKVKKRGLPKNTDLRLIRWTVEVDRWLDSNTAILHASLEQVVRENPDQGFGADFLFTLKFDNAGTWKIVKAHELSEKEIEKREKGQTEEPEQETPSADASFRDADGQLNEVYNALRARLSRSERDSLKKEQLAWLNQRNAAVQVAKESPPGNSTDVADREVTKMTQARVAELEKRLKKAK